MTRADFTHPLRRLCVIDRVGLTVLAALFGFAAWAARSADIPPTGPIASTYPWLFGAAGVAMLAFVVYDHSVTYALSGTLAVTSCVARALGLAHGWARGYVTLGEQSIELRIAIYLGLAIVLSLLWRRFGVVPEVRR